MSKIWSFMLVISIIIAFSIGVPDTIVNSIMDSSKNAIENVITLASMMCFWSGIFNIFEKTNASKKFSKVFGFLFKGLFDKNKLSSKAQEYISMNVSTNILGIGNASTINGIKAMEEMQKSNELKDSPSDNMAIFVLLNTASLQLIPTNMIAMRASFGSQNPASIVIPIWIVTALSLIAGIISIKILNKKM